MKVREVLIHEVMYSDDLVFMSEGMRGLDILYSDDLVFMS